MNKTRFKNGFTLVEILLTLALIASVLSMVFGSYVATSRSAEVYRDGMAICRQGRIALDQMARQTRCAYAGRAVDAVSGESDIRGKTVARQDSVSYFSGCMAGINGEILRFVATSGLTHHEGGPPVGLFEVAYRFDTRARTLFFSQGRFLGRMQKTGSGDWMPVAENVERLNLEFFDGRQWLRRWDFEDKKELPSAVRIEIRCTDQSNRRYDYSTVAHVSSGSRRAETAIETLASVNRL